MNKLKKFYKGVIRLLKSYGKNVFDGKITSLIGFALIIAGIVQAFRGAGFMDVSEYVVFGLIVAGFRDPRLGRQGQNDSPKEP